MSSSPSAKWLRAKEIPYALTLLLALLSWGVVRMIDKIEDSPTLAYSRSVEKLPDDGGWSVKYRIENISRKELFKKVSFYIESSDKQPLTDEQMEPLAPAKQASGSPEPSNQESVVGFYIAQFQPGTSWDLSVKTIPKEDPKNIALTVDFSPKPAESETQSGVEPVPLRLVPDGVETFFVRHQVGLLAIASLCWIGLIITYICSVHPSLR